eukprot:4567778-Amphidinium_carterae.1
MAAHKFCRTVLAAKERTNTSSAGVPSSSDGDIPVFSALLGEKTADTARLERPHCRASTLPRNPLMIHAVSVTTSLCKPMSLWMDLTAVIWVGTA